MDAVQAGEPVCRSIKQELLNVPMGHFHHSLTLRNRSLMTHDEIEEQLKKLGETSKEFDERGALLALTAMGQHESPDLAFQWLSGQWTTGFSALPRVARLSLPQQYDLVLHIFGIANTMLKCGFPNAEAFLLHATEIRTTFETIAALENMLLDLEDGHAEERLH